MRADASCRVRANRNMICSCGSGKKIRNVVARSTNGLEVRLRATQTAPEWDRVARDREVGVDGDRRFLAISGAARR